MVRFVPLPCSVCKTGQGFFNSCTACPAQLINRDFVEENGLNVLVETENSKARTEKRRFLVNMLLSCISAISAITAAIFAALTYINS